MSTRICPLCVGRGFVEIATMFPNRDRRRTLAKKLRRSGLSLRLIARALGYRNHNSVCRLLRS